MSLFCQFRGRAFNICIASGSDIQLAQRSDASSGFMVRTRYLSAWIRTIVLGIFELCGTCIFFLSGCLLDLVFSWRDRGSQAYSMKCRSQRAFPDAELDIAQPMALSQALVEPQVLMSTQEPPFPQPFFLGGIMVSGRLLVELAATLRVSGTARSGEVAEKSRIQCCSFATGRE